MVIDNGTGYTKMGYAGNDEPQYIVPTVAGFKGTQVTITQPKDNPNIGHTKPNTEYTKTNTARC